MLAQQFQTYLAIEKQFAPLTLDAYQRDLAQLQSYLKDQYGLDLYEGPSCTQVTHKHLRAWMGELMNQQLASRSIARKLSAAKSYFRFLQRSQKVTQNPASRLKVPRFEKKLPQFLKQRETQYLFEEALFSDDFDGIRDRAIMELLYGCGLRRSELVSLQAQQLDLYNLQLRVLGKGNKERIVPFGQHVKQAIEAYLLVREKVCDGTEKALFLRKNGQPIYAQLVYRMVKKYLSQVSSLQQKSPHVMRHTFATHLLDEGADLNAIKELLGHSSLASTQVYTHNSITKLKDIFQQAHPRATTHKE